MFETLEQRQLLAGPQLIGIQPNEGELIVDGSVRDTAPRSLTFRFDQDQQIDANTLDAIQITRSGADGRFGTADDQVVPVGSVELGALSDNEVVVRFADSLPDDRYRVDVFGFDAPNRGIVGLRNTDGDLLVARDGVSDNERIEFELRLGAKIEAIVPQPVVRLPDRSLEQRRDEILIYFNDDELFVENDPATGLPTERSAENPRFYQLLLTQETVRTTDDVFYQPDRVIYDSATNTARLIFADDLNQLPGVSKGGGTFRLRVGTAVDTAADLIVTPTELNVVPRVSSNLGAAAGLNVEFASKVFGESQGQKEVQFIDSGNGGLSVSLDAGGNVLYDFGGATVTVQALRDATTNEPTVDAVLAVNFALDEVAGSGGETVLPSTLAGTTLRLAAAGDMLTTATDIGVLGSDNQLLTSILISESIDPKSYGIQLPGAVTDPGRADPGTAIANAVNDSFGPDSTDGITEIEYNFQGIFAGGVGTGIPAQLNNITEVQKRRVREAINLWSNYLGVQFRETADSGITFALGTTTELTPVSGTDLRTVDVIDASLRIDPTFTDSAIVFSNQASFDLDYGDDFFRKAMAGVGLLLGLEQNGDVDAQTLMALNPEFLNAGINAESFVSPIDPFFEIQSSQNQTFNPAIDSQSINEPLPNALEGPEPVFPGRQDILHGQHLHRPDSVDVDLYKFEVSLDAGREFGTLTVESFAERLADSSLLDTSLTLFEDVSASATTNFGLGSDVSVRVDSQLPGNMGNRSRIEFIQTDRSVGDTGVRVDRIAADNGELVENAIRIDLPRRGPAISSLTVSEVIEAINNDPFASTLFELTQVDGDGSEDLIDAPLSSYNPIRLAGGGTVPLTRNDDYFSEDSLLTAQLSNGVYYIGVAASGNDNYDPALEGSAVGGRTQGEYELLLKFEPQVSQTDVIRDLDSDRIGVPGTAIDGDLDGRPSGVKNFWFQTRPQERVLEIVSNGSGLVAGETVTLTGADGATRRFEFVPFGQNASAGNIPVRFSPLNTISDVTVNLAAAINTNGAALGISASPEVNAADPNAPAFLVLSGERAVSFSAGFQGINALGRTLFVDKVATVVADGSLDQPFNNINGISGNGAFAATLPGDIVRVVGNGGQDNDISTPADNFSYQVGLEEIGGGVLADGRHLDIPQGVTMMVDAGAAFKLRSSTVSVGSNNLLSDRSNGALQVLGTPTLLQVGEPTFNGNEVTDPGLVALGASGNVVFTSTRDRAVDTAASGNSPAPSDGNWGGLIFRSDFDRLEGRGNLEDEGIFLQVVNHADIRFGGGSNILINSVQQTVNPIQIVDLRPTVTFNRVTDNAGAAMSASPDAFLETRFQSPQFQQAGAFTADYSRIGPDIKQNLVVDNSINGLFIRTVTGVDEPARQITVAAHIDDVDIVHYIAENILIAGQPGGPIEDGFVPDISSVTAQTAGGGALSVGDYEYRLTFVDGGGFESLASESSGVITTTDSARQIQLLNLPLIPSGSDYLTRRLYRLDPGSSEYRLVSELNRSTATFVDDGSDGGGAILDLTRQGVRARLDGSLVIDPNTVVKFRGARIELDHSTQLLAEGTRGQNVIFTSSLDDRFGAGGSFDTNEDAGTPGGGADPARGDWSGIYASPTAHVSLDHAVVAYGGGVSLIEGGQSRGFAALELQQASARVTN
ncbi:MAG: peptidase, partial [Planctomycetota bacterium]